MSNVTSAALWHWNTTGPTPTVDCFSSGNQTKTGLQPQDLQDYVSVPLQIFGATPTPISAKTILSWIRMAEDAIEAETGILLCQSWIASPPAFDPETCNALSITPSFSGGYQKQGYDYDIEDSGYDFVFNRAQDAAWLMLSLRYKPLKSVTYAPGFSTAIKRTAFIYPLLSQYFSMPPQWNVEDHDYGLVRFVPATNIAMLPLYAMQLSFLGSANSIPNAIWLQYTAGLTPTDYATRFSFMKQLVLAKAAQIAFTSIQGTVNLGVEQTAMQIDGVSYSSKYNPEGAFSGLIMQFGRQADALMRQAITMCAGPVFGTFG